MNSCTAKEAGPSPQELNVEALRRQVQVSRHAWKRWTLIGIGWVLTVIGVVGLVLPGLPGTPLLLLAAACFARGSERFFIWLLTNPYFGGYVRDWRDAKGIPVKIKVRVTALLVVSFAITILFLVPLMAVKILLVLIASGVLMYIWSQPNAPDPRAGHRGFDD